MTKRIILLMLGLALLLMPAALLNTRQGVFAGEVFLPRTDSGYGPIVLTRQEGAIDFTGTAADTDFAAVMRRDDSLVSNPHRRLERRKPLQ